MRSHTHIVQSPNIWAKQQKTMLGYATPITYGESQAKSSAHSIITVRSSDASYKTVSSGGGHIHSAVQQSMVYHHDYNRINTWNHITLPVSSPTGKTTSFTSIHQEVDQDLSNQQWTAEITSGPRRIGPGGPAIGEDKPGSPVGDMLLPMLVIALGYVVVKLFRNRKTSQAL